ncbi:uncharacterized protein LOC121047135, partial [Ixodes scapularis]|uniref:uncharacterized protein LOC121047135 n=1 Tax=Ixodes scapularis TaxID=6945 RepID=UPI001AD66FC1
GARLNAEKSNGFWIGAWATTPKCFGGISWNRCPSKYLGVPLDQTRSTDPYWSTAVTIIRHKSQAWRAREMSIFANAAVCNTFLISKLMYVLQVLHCNRSKIQAFLRIFATFIWSSPWERMKRDNLFLPLDSGGLGLAHLFVRQLVSRLFFFRNLSHPFLLMAVQRKLVHHLPFLIVSTTSSAPSGPWGFWKEVVDTFLFLKVRFSLDYLFEVPRKRLAQALIESFFPAPLYRSKFGNCEGQDVLKRVKRMSVSPSTKTFMFKLHTSTLPVKWWLQDRGFFVPWSIDCHLCHQPETIEHCFIYCTVAIFFWDVLRRTLRKDIDLTDHSIRYLYVPNETNIPYDLFMLIGLHSLWRCRMIDRNADIPRTTQSIFLEEIAKVRSVYEAHPTVPHWFPLFDTCLGLPDF